MRFIVTIEESVTDMDELFEVHQLLREAIEFNTEYTIVEIEEEFE